MSKGLLFGVLALGCAVAAVGAPIVGYVEDVDTDSMANWTAVNAFTGLPPSKGSDDGDQSVGGENALQITADTSGSFLTFRDRVYDATDLVGDYTAIGTGVKRIHFDFYSQTSTAGAVNLFIQDGTYIWYSPFGNLGPGWSERNMNLDWTLGSWSPGAGTPAGEGAFLAALQSVDAVGLEFSYRINEASQVFAIDNFWLDDEFMVPEPGSIAALLSVFVSLGVVFRRKLGAALPGIKAKLS